MADNRVITVPLSERSGVPRAVCMWLSTCEELPVARVEYEYLTLGGMAVSSSQAPYKVRQFIDGSYDAEYDFVLAYLSTPTTADERFGMDELLESVAIWVEGNAPDLGDNIIVQSIECTDNATMTARYEDGTEEHQITFKLTYEVRK